MEKGLIVSNDIYIFTLCPQYSNYRDLPTKNKVAQLGRCGDTSLRPQHLGR